MTNVNTLIDHFMNSARGYNVRAANSLISGDVDGFKSILSQIAELPVVRMINNAVSTSKAASDAFLKRAELSLSKLGLGLWIAAAGSLIGAEAGGIALAFGLSAVIVQAVAVILMVIGISMMARVIVAKLREKLAEVDLGDLLG